MRVRWRVVLRSIADKFLLIAIAVLMLSAMCVGVLTDDARAMCGTFDSVEGRMIVPETSIGGTVSPCSNYDYLVYHTINDGTEIEITDYCGPGGPVTIPGEIEGKPVTTIGYLAFYEGASITSVTIPDNVTTIGSFSFYGCTSLTSIDLPQNVTTIGSASFYGCASLTSVDIPRNVTTIEDYAFVRCGAMTSITVDPSNPCYSSSDGILYNRSMTRLITFPAGRGGPFTISENVTTISYDAFAYSSLTSITIPDNVTTISYGAFEDCTSLTSVTMGDGVTVLEPYAFFGCTSLTSISIPENVTMIDSFAFFRCTSLTSVTIPYNVTTVGKEAFSYCTALTDITFEGLAPSMGLDWVDNHNASLTVHYYSGAAGFTTPTWEGIPSIPITNFDGFEYDLIDNDTEVRIVGYTGANRAIVIPGSIMGNPVSAIGDRAFSDRSLTSVTMPDTVTTIGDGAFYQCTSLSSITIPDNVTTIGNGAFQLCLSLSSVTMPDSVTTIGDDAFHDCPLTTITMGDGVSSIGDRAFSGCRAITVTIPDGVTTIGHAAFFHCTDLVRVTIGSNVTIIGDEAFSCCRSLTNIVVSPSNPNLRSSDGVLFDGTMTELMAFPCGGAGSYTVPDGVTGIGGSAFRYCTLLTSITIPDTVSSIGAYAFATCPELCSMTFEGDAPTTGPHWIDDHSDPLTVYYFEGSTGFTTPTWNGVQSVCLSVPDAPSDLAAVSADGHVDLTWTVSFDGNSTITHYSVYRDGALLANVSGTWYDDATVVDGREYTYSVTAVNDVGEGDHSDSAIGNTAPAVPSGLQVVSGPGWNNVSWLMPADGGSSVTHFNVSTETSVEVTALEVLNHIGDRWYYNITDIVPGTQCNYTVSAMNAVGWSDVSNSVMGTSVPAAPCELTAHAVKSSVTLTWTAPANGGSNITTYNVYRNGTYIGNVTGTSYVDGTVDACTWYSYSVIALNAVGEGPASSIDVLVPDETSPTVVDNSPTGDDVLKDASIVIEFSEPMDHDSVIVTCGSVTLTPSWSGNVVTLTHDAFDANTTYDVVVNGDDLHGNAMEEYTWTFTTEDAVTMTGVVSNGDGPVVNATVTLDSGESTTTDSEGRYTLTTTTGEHTITVSKDGFDTVTETVTVTTSAGQTFDETLNPTTSSSILWLGVIVALVVVAAIALVVYRRR